MQEKEAWAIITNSIKKKIIKKGVDGKSPRDGTNVTIIITNCNNENYIDVSKEKPFDYCIGFESSDFELILSQCLESMKKNEESKFQISLRDNREPLLFNIYLQDYSPTPDVWEMSVSEKIAMAKTHKEFGSKLFQNQNLTKALNQYSLSIKYLLSIESDMEGADAKTISQANQLKAQCYLNIAACQLANDNSLKYVVQNCGKCLELEPNNTKALYRRALAQIRLQNYEEAADDIEKALQIEPNNKALQDLSHQCHVKQKEMDHILAQNLSKII